MTAQFTRLYVVLFISTKIIIFIKYSINHGVNKLIFLAVGYVLGSYLCILNKSNLVYNLINIIDSKHPQN